MAAPSTRSCAVAGVFYPREPRQLAAEVDGFLRASREVTSECPKALIVPHAGYMYSGVVAASAYAGLSGCAQKIRRVVLLGPNHRVALGGMAVPTADFFDSPFGAIPVDREAVTRILELPGVVMNDRPHLHEHALEVQLPFLQRLLGKFEIVPVVVGSVVPAQVEALLEALWGGDETLIVVSSDLSHYLPHAEAQTRDHLSMEKVLALSPTLDQLDACGATPINGLLRAARAHGLTPHVLDLRNSGDTAGDQSRVVGYAAVSFDHAPSAPTQPH